MLKICKRKSVLDHACNKINRQLYSQLPKKLKRPYRYRMIMCIRALWLDIKITRRRKNCPYCCIICQYRSPEKDYLPYYCKNKERQRRWLELKHRKGEDD